MRPTTVALILVILIAVCAAIFVEDFKASAHTGRYVVSQTAGNGLNLRTGPSGDYRVIMTMQRGDAFKARGHRGNWMYGTHLATGNTGWAWMSYLEPAPATSSSGGGGAICLTNYWREWVCSSVDVGNAIRYWAGQYGIGWWWLAATAACESSFHIYAVNQWSGVSGLFQFQPSTFYAWGGHDLWDPWDQSRIASKMFAAGEARQYFCAILIGYA